MQEKFSEEVANMYKESRGETGVGSNNSMIANLKGTPNTVMITNSVTHQGKSDYIDLKVQEAYDKIRKSSSISLSKTIYGRHNNHMVGINRENAAKIRRDFYKNVKHVMKKFRIINRASRETNDSMSSLKL
ncbi:hypothetical protein BGC07_06060 [Piscirickettsia litoralis]|uniref:Uncharacterized protein n=2 Tax=Piscirickettsia litoralis TaxID=1891921 RepID=A0ABX3A575_9GAMM|nr:hypothetical protein BGC07_06060 [Piscirickettsia litoralis]